MTASCHPSVVICLCGKRKSGKDFVAERLLELFKDVNVVAVITRLSSPLKGQYAIDHGLDWKRLLDSSEYKEKHRFAMITWGEKQRMKDPSFFCRHAVKETMEAAATATATAAATNSLDVMVVSDARRPSDMSYFLENYKDRCITMRVQASEEIRHTRGFVFTPGIDDADSECALDDFNVHHTLNNDGDVLELERSMADVIAMTFRKMNTT